MMRLFFYYYYFFFWFHVVQARAPPPAPLPASTSDYHHHHQRQQQIMSSSTARAARDRPLFSTTATAAAAGAGAETTISSLEQQQLQQQTRSRRRHEDEEEEGSSSTSSSISIIEQILEQIHQWKMEKRHSNNDIIGRQDLPFVTLAFAQSLDGCIGTIISSSTFQHQPHQHETKKKSSSNLALSGPLSQILTHALRSCHDAILIGGNTLLIDNPRLNNRLWPPPSHSPSFLQKKKHQPRPVILDTHLTAITAMMQNQQQKDPLRLGNNHPIVCCSEGAFHQYLQQQQQQQEEEEEEEEEETNTSFKDSSSAPSSSDTDRHSSITFLPCPLTPDGQLLDLTFILRHLKQDHGITSVMVEGGGRVLSAFANNESSKNDKQLLLVDCICITVAPQYLNHQRGQQGYPAFSNLDQNDHAAHLSFANPHLFLLRPDMILLSQWPPPPPPPPPQQQQQQHII
jgi:riboflavin biosynthesis pyrimidine reductase